MAGPEGAPPDVAPPGWPLDWPPALPGSVAQLLAVPGTARDVDWLRSSLQTAVAIELSTIPPYLCGWWSVKDRKSEAAVLIRRIVGDEMYHLGVVCNLLVAVGGRPRIKEAAPTYPTPLPGGVRAGVNVYLSGLTRPFVHDVMMAIEAPETPLTRSGQKSPTVGDFYEELLRAFRRTKPALTSRGQLSSRIGSDVLQPVGDLDGVERSIEIVKEQGEGTTSSPDDTFGDDGPAHYYAFGEIYHGRRVRDSGGSWGFTGSSVPFPEARPMARVPAGGWPDPPVRVRRLLDQFDTTYNTVLENLDEAWNGGGADSLNSAVRAMRAMEAPAVQLMEIALPDGAGHYGPQFRVCSNGCDS
ncbi:ferritin-like domain-containing protein [Streptomyces sp. DW26H14]|uniref:ferritin-like domain-containing protein n=1 Tax=Streptomyces sp. DW26H14 TaxID=3435395 RepID=UPI00403DD000